MSVNEIKNQAWSNSIPLYVCEEKLIKMYLLSEISRVLLMFPNGNAVHSAANDHTHWRGNSMHFSAFLPNMPLIGHNMHYLLYHTHEVQ